MRILMLAMVVTVGCSQPNPEACCTTADQCLTYGLSGITNCDSGHVCSMEGNCVAPTLCKVDADCNDASMVCNMNGQCVPEGGGSASQYTLTVQVGGSGSGSITSTPAGITCSSGACTGVFDTGTEVQLTQSPTTGSFLGWAYGCHGTDMCSVTLNADQRVGALFGTPGEGLWAKQVDASGNNSGNDVVSTADGDIIAVGAYAGTLNLDSIVLMTGDDTVSNSYVAKLDGWTGNTIWAKSFPLGSAVGVALDSDGQMYVLGTFSGTADLGSGHILNAGGGTDVYLLKLDQTGVLVWSFSFGGLDDEYGYRLAVTSGRVVIEMGNSGSSYVAALDATAGTVKWIKSVAPGNGFGVAIDAANVVVSGTFAAAFDFGSGAVTPIGDTDAFVARYAVATGSLVSIDQYGAAATAQHAFDVAEDDAGNTFVSGLILGSTKQIYVTKFSSVGSIAWTHSFNWTSVNGNSTISSLGFSESGDVMMSGTFCGTVTMGVDQVGPSCSTQAPRFGSYTTQLRNSTGEAGLTSVLVPNVLVNGISKAATDGRQFATGTFSGAITFPTQVLLCNVSKHDGYITASAP